MALHTGQQDSKGSTTRVVPCGKCPACLQTRRKAWAFRLYQELKHSKTAYFLTFTYEETPKSFNGHDTLNKKDFQDFMKRLRKRQHYPLKYYTSGEYGDLIERPHYHSIMYNLEPKLAREQRLADIWTHGHVDIGTVTMASIMYTCGYIMKGVWKPKDELDDRDKQFSIMSKNLGRNFLTPAQVDYLRNKKEPFVTREGGEKLTLPRYYKEKIFAGENKLLTLGWKAQAEKTALEFEEKFEDAKHKLEWTNHQFLKALELQNQKTNKINNKRLQLTS